MKRAPIHVEPAARLGTGASHLERLVRQARRYTPEDREGLRLFHEEMFGPDCRQLDEPRFRWLYEEPPVRPPGAPTVWIFPKDGGIAGEQAGIAHRIKIGRKEHNGSWPIDLMVRPEFRLRGFGPALSEAHAAAFDLAIAAGATDLAYPTYVRLGWHDLGGIPFFLKPIDIGQILSMRLVLRGPITIGTRLLSWALHRLEAAGRIRSHRSAPALEWIPRFDERVNAVWESCSPRYRVLARRDLDALRWRFDHPVPAGRYQRAYLLRDGAVSGYVVVRTGRLLGAPMGYVVDYLCLPEDASALLSACVEHFRRQSVAGVVCEMLNEGARAHLRRTGFLKIRRRVNRRLLWKSGGGDAPDAAMLDDRHNWFVTRADGDADHPDPRVDQDST